MNMQEEGESLKDAAWMFGVVAVIIGIAAYFIIPFIWK